MNKLSYIVEIINRNKKECTEYEMFLFNNLEDIYKYLEQNNFSSVKIKPILNK